MNEYQGKPDTDEFKDLSGFACQDEAHDTLSGIPFSDRKLLSWAGKPKGRIGSGRQQFKTTAEYRAARKRQRQARKRSR